MRKPSFPVRLRSRPARRREDSIDGKSGEKDRHDPRRRRPESVGGNGQADKDIRDEHRLAAETVDKRAENQKAGYRTELQHQNKSEAFEEIAMLDSGQKCRGPGADTTKWFYARSDGISGAGSRQLADECRAGAAPTDRPSAARRK